ncbi:MAG: 2-dehydropantoate 2-reductase N-terminal domain-containing protein, partial [Oscillospiraceae bacterium]
MANLFILGSGGFGTSLAVMLSGAGHRVTLWGWSKKENDVVRAARENVALLKGVGIPEAVKIVDEIDGVEDADAVLIATPTIGVRNAARMLAGRLAPRAVVACVSKGLEPKTLEPLYQVVAEELPGVPFVALSGPSHAEEVARGVPT